MKKIFSYSAFIVIPLFIASFIFINGQSYNIERYIPPIHEASSANFDNDGSFDKVCEKWFADSVEWFPKQNMADKINGRAPYYEKFGCSGLFFVCWFPADNFKVIETQKNSAWDMYMFVMDDANAAYGVYVGEKPNNEVKEHDNLGDYAWSLPGTLNCVIGNYYLKFSAFTASDNPDNLTNLIKKLSEKYSDKTLSEKPSISQKKLPDFIKNNLEIIPKDAFGFTSLRNVSSGKQEINGEIITAYLSYEPNTFPEYISELEEYGAKIISKTDIEITSFFIGEYDRVKLVKVNDTDFIYGVRGAKSLESLEAFWKKMQVAIEKAGDNNE